MRRSQQKREGVKEEELATAIYATRTRKAADDDDSGARWMVSVVVAPLSLSLLHFITVVMGKEKADELRKRVFGSCRQQRGQTVAHSLKGKWEPTKEKEVNLRTLDHDDDDGGRDRMSIAYT